MKAIYLISLLFYFDTTIAQKSQIEVLTQDDGDFKKEKIIENLVIQGVKILDVKSNFTIEDLCMGYFIDPSSYMGIEQGMILSTGTVEDIVRENKETNYTSIGIDSTQLLKFLELSKYDSISYQDSILLYQQLLNEIISKNIKPGDSDLSNEIEGLQTFDARVITIKFVPTADTFYYRYVFASEEYDEFVCSQYNDIFAFYIYQEESNKTNTALVPIKNIPVSINNINNGNSKNPHCNRSNSHLYQKNDGNQNLLYDGFTKVLDIRYKVNPGEVYYMKIAIADASDGVLDSAVLIENKSVFSYFESFEMFFLSESYEIQGFQRMEKIVSSLNNHPNSKVQLIGHADITGPEDYNLELSIKRVNSIKEYLVANGIENSRIIEKYKGELMPRYKEHSKNRRVEIFILGK